MNLASTLRVCLHFDGKNEARDPRASFSPCAQIHKSENIISVSFTPFTWGNKYKTHKSKQKYKKPKTIYSQLMNCSYRCVCAHHCVQLHVVHNTTQNSSYCVDTFADSEPYCHSVCLSGCLSVIPRPTAYHDWSITTKVCRTRVSLFGSPISHTFGATAKNMQRFAYFQRQPYNAYFATANVTHRAIWLVIFLLSSSLSDGREIIMTKQWRIADFAPANTTQQGR